MRSPAVSGVAGSPFYVEGFTLRFFRKKPLTIVMLSALEMPSLPGLECSGMSKTTDCSGSIAAILLLHFRVSLFPGETFSILRTI